MSIIGIPLADCADEWIGQLARATGAATLTQLDGATLLGERAMLSGFTIPGRISAGGGCRLYAARDDRIALNLSRATDRELLPALFEVDDFDTNDPQTIASHVARYEASALLARGRLMGLAIAAEREATTSNASACAELTSGTARIDPSRSRPRVIDLSALWAGPLASHLLWLAGAEVIKVESRTRPDAMRDGDQGFYALLNQGKASVALNFADHNDRQVLLAMIADADIVIEAARPRALLQLGIDAAQMVRATPGLTWLTITGHGATNDAANWVGFGDDCGVAGGLTAALREASSRDGFVGDAIADPLTGIYSAIIAWRAWQSHRGGRFGVGMSRVAATALAEAFAQNPVQLNACLQAWSLAQGRPFPTVTRRAITTLPAFGQDTHAYMSRFASC
jgi:hypothetical protein